MRCHRPDIIVILAVAVATGVLLTTTAQAQGFSGATASDLTHSADPTCLLLCSHGWTGNWLLHLWRPKGLVVDVPAERVAPLDAAIADPRNYPGGGVHYDFMFNRVSAVMLNGNMDLTLRVGNYHHPVPQLDPYLLISLAGRW